MTSQPGPSPQLNGNASDRQLVEAVAIGRDHMAFEILLDRYQRPLFGFIRRQVGVRSDAEDLYQQTVLRIFDRLDTCKDPDAFRSWAFGIAANICRYEGKRQRVRSGETLEGEMDLRPGWSQTPEAAASTGQVRNRIAEALGKLPAGQREVFVLYHYSNLNYDEIAGVLGAPIGTVKSRMNAALTGLRTLLAGLTEGGAP